MISRRDLLCAGALAPLSTYSFAAPAYKAGKEYLTVHPMAPTPADKIEVVEFFAYTCPHCLQFHPVFHEWAQKAPEDVSIRICPSPGSRSTFRSRTPTSRSRPLVCLTA